MLDTFHTTVFSHLYRSPNTVAQVLSGHTYPILSWMTNIHVGLIDVNFLCPQFFGCCLFLFLYRYHFQIQGCLHLRIFLLEPQKSVTVWLLIELGIQKKYFSTSVGHSIPKTNFDQVLLKFWTLLSDFTWKCFCSACATIKKFLHRPGITAISGNATGWIFLSCFWQPCQPPRFFLVSLLLSPTATLIYAYHRTVIFSLVVTVCDMEPVSTIKTYCNISYLGIL